MIKNKLKGEKLRKGDLLGKSQKSYISDDCQKQMFLKPRFSYEWQI